MRIKLIMILTLLSSVVQAKSRPTTYEEKKAWAIENCRDWFSKEEKEAPAVFNNCVEVDIDFAPKWTK